MVVEYVWRGVRRVDVRLLSIVCVRGTDMKFPDSLGG